MITNNGQPPSARPPALHRLFTSEVSKPDQQRLSQIFGPNGETACITNLGLVSDVAVDRAINFVDGSGIYAQIAEWTDEYYTAMRGNHARAGRRSAITMRELLILLFVTVLDEKAPLLTTVEEILTERMTTDQLAKIGVPVAFIRKEGLYSRIWRVMDRFITAVDPYPSVRNRRISWADHTALVAAEAADPMVQVQLARLDWFASYLMEATWRTLPHSVRAKWQGNLAADGTLIAGNQNGTSNKYMTVGADRDAAWWGRGGNHHVEDGKGSREKHRNGYEATAVVTVPNFPRDKDAEPEFPVVVLGMGFGKPGTEIGEIAANATLSIHHRGHPAGLWLGDLAYAPHALPQKLQTPIRTVGYKIVSQLRGPGKNDDGDLGIQAEYKGAFLVEGRWMGACIPPKLRDSTITFRTIMSDPKSSDEDRAAAIEDYEAAIEKRKKYELRPKLKSNNAEQTATPYRCPAAGPSPTLVCPIKPNPRAQALAAARIEAHAEAKAIGKKVNEVEALTPVAYVPEHPDEVCTNKESISIPFEVGVRWEQEFAFGTAEHRDAFALRSVVEGWFGFAKTSAEQIGSPSRRQVKGFAAQYVLTAILFAGTNLRKIRRFLKERPQQDHEVDPTTLDEQTAETETDSRAMAPLAWLPFIDGSTLDSDAMGRRRDLLDKRKAYDLKLVLREQGAEAVAEIRAQRWEERRAQKEITRSALNKKMRSEMPAPVEGLEELAS